MPCTNTLGRNTRTVQLNTCVINNQFTYNSERGNTDREDFQYDQRVGESGPTYHDKIYIRDYSHSPRDKYYRRGDSGPMYQNFT